MRIYRVLAIVIFGIFTSYAFYLPNGMLEKIKVYRSAATGRGVIVVPVTLEGAKLERERYKYGL